MEHVNSAAAQTAEEIIAMAKREAKRILRQAQRELSRETADETRAKAPARSVPVTQADDCPMVELTLFADSGSYCEPMAVKWGGRQFLIPRGVRVQVPAPVAEIIRISQAQEHKTAALIRRLERDNAR